LTLTRNPYYRGLRPALDGLNIRFINPNEVDVAVSEGRFDLVGPLPPSVPHPAPPTFTDFIYPTPQAIYLAVNYNPRNEAPFTAEMRQALLLALNRETILAETLKEDGQLLAGSLLPGHWAANPDLTWPDYDPQTARRLLAKAGLKDEDGDGWLDRAGQRLEVGLRLNGENPLHQNLGWLISSYYRELGLFARAEGVSFDNLVDDLFTHDFEVALFSWPLLPDPDQRLYWRSDENKEGVGLNFVSYDNPRLDRLLDRAVAVPGCSAPARAEIYVTIQTTLAQERPVDFLLAPHYHLLVARRLGGVNPGPFAPLTWNVTDWYLKEE
jgi:peptide/nickel transport system substrate-binding protein